LEDLRIMSKIPVDIVSGFLGSGKTTLINEMLKSVYKDKKIAIIENEFGDVSIDSELFSGEMEITELTNGCVCCSLKTDLAEGISKLHDLNRFDRIVIEPSGVAKLSDMKYIFEDKLLLDKIEKGVCITIINPKVHKNFSENFGEFYNDQIENADAIYISRTDQISEEVLLDLHVDLKLNSDAEIFDRLPSNILSIGSKGNVGQLGCGCSHKKDEQGCGGGCRGHKDESGGCQEGEDGGCNHSHGDASDRFFSYNLDFEMFEDEREIEDTVDRIIKHSSGEVLRIKGFLSAEDRSYLVQWVAGQLEITLSDVVKNKLVIIEAKCP